VFPPEFIDGLKIFSEYKHEVGGGIVLNDKKNAIVRMVIFPSDQRSRITFDNTRYDIEFHTHPVLSNKREDIIYSRIPSPADISSTFTTGKEEPVFAGNFVFCITIRDKNAFENAKRRVREWARGKKHANMYERYRDYFNVVFDSVLKASKKYTGIKKARYISYRWKHVLKKHGVLIKKVDLEHAKFNIY